MGRTNPATSPARRRMLDTASRLFYEEGIHTVGVDRIIAEAGVAKATFYSHFPAKNDLVCEYLTQQSRLQRTAVDSARTERRAAGRPPRDVIIAIFDAIGEIGCGSSFRGCAFLNAAAEYPDPAHPVRAVVADHRRWFREMLCELLLEAGHPDATRTAAMLLLVRDGLVIDSHLDDAADVRALVRTLVERVLDEGPPTTPRSLIDDRPAHDTLRR